MTQTRHMSTRKVSIKERSVLVGDIIVVNGYNVDRAALAQRFAEAGYQPKETPHFLLFTRVETPQYILVHWFSPEEMNADIKHYVMYELKPLGLLRESRHFGEILSGIIGSFFPDNARLAWHGYGAKTLQRFLLFLSTAHTPHIFDYYATIGTFANRYQRVCELCIGESLLDVGSESGQLPLIIAERIPFMKRVMGIDIQMDMLTIARELATERNLCQVEFAQVDLLTNDLGALGQFDTVTVLHVLEHFTEAEMYRVLARLLPITSKRLILAVPYEDEAPEVIYEHQQIFTPAKLEALGRWCLQQWEEAGRTWQEECEGGLLLIERQPYN